MAKSSARDKEDWVLLLERMFDQFVRERRNRRIARVLLKEQKAAALGLFDTDLDVLRKTFASTPPTLRSRLLPNYPGAMWMGHIGVSAFGVTQDIEVEQFPVYFNLVATGCERVGRHRFGRDSAIGHRMHPHPNLAKVNYRSLGALCPDISAFT
ncbi:hypothetical protein [Burkholderia contaminans]|uniref:hypothetical protein n=1 Tax=Burkholderia contaminans TaxID=488447 RepID=UPI000F568B0D|nr:hypothetical protein [Burkholderia contaminans]